MPTVTNNQILFVQRPAGHIEIEKTFKASRTTIDTEKDVPNGGILVQNLLLSLDPAMRGWMNDARSYIAPIKIGDVMRGGGIGRVVASKNPKFKVGDLVEGMFCWQEYFLSPDGKGISVLRLPHPKLRIEDAMGSLGMTALTAYFGILDVGRPKDGDVIVVSGAAGATGMMAGQIAKCLAKNVTVIGIAGSDDKCKILVDELGFDKAINYKSPDWRQKLKEYTPKFIDLYFDNTGGPILEECLRRIATYGRVVLCGAISQYNSAPGSSTPPVGPASYINLITQRGRMEGFIVFDYQKRYPEAYAKLSQWVVEGKIEGKETVVKGLPNAPEALLALFDGKNIGKMMVQVADDSQMPKAKL
ncbi:NADP-dependent leukotriene B4 12-hydroxydehydrogenase [Cladochytrium replicatum]|nr:NADP-dependent leukotriene B4 12-hydroxydehydrogenase [Cladochytrium replicatum]